MNDVVIPSQAYMPPVVDVISTNGCAQVLCESKGNKVSISNAIRLISFSINGLQ